MLIKKHLLDIFMVDYLLTQPPYTAKNVELIFNVSDHAAIVGDVYGEQEIMS